MPRDGQGQRLGFLCLGPLATALWPRPSPAAVAQSLSPGPLARASGQVCCLAIARLEPLHSIQSQPLVAWAGRARAQGSVVAAPTSRSTGSWPWAQLALAATCAELGWQWVDSSMYPWAFQKAQRFVRRAVPLAGGPKSGHLRRSKIPKLLVIHGHQTSCNFISSHVGCHIKKHTLQPWSSG